MQQSFYDWDYNILLNEKRDEQLRTENDKILGKFSNIIIIYSAISFFLVPIIQDFIDKKFSITYLITLILFAILFLISIYYTSLFIYPKQIGTLLPPAYFYTHRKAQLEAEQPPKNQGDIDKILKNFYIVDLERSVTENLNLFIRKQGFYNRGLAFALFSLIPFIGCVVFHLHIKTDTPSVKIENIEKLRTFTIDSTRVVYRDTCKKINNPKKRRNGKKEKKNAIEHSYTNFYYFKGDSGATIKITNNYNSPRSEN